MVVFLGDILKIESGSLLSRIVDEHYGEEYQVYENDQFYSSYSIANNTEHRKSIRTTTNVQRISTGEIVISLYKGQCTLIREEFDGNIINANFAKVTVDDTRIDKNYFVYWLNESLESKKQLFQDIEGSVMKKITIGKLRNMKITLPTRETQELIGSLYITQMNLSGLYEKNNQLKQLRTIEKIKILEGRGEE